MLAANFRHRF